LKGKFAARRSLMAGMFEERERGYEAKWAHDEERLFKVTARRNDILGRWAAAELGLSGAKADKYATAVVRVGLAGVKPVFDKIRGDFDAQKLDYSDQAIHLKMAEFFDFASHEAIK
jgi:hypothetical protein